MRAEKAQHLRADVKGATIRHGNNKTLVEARERDQHLRADVKGATIRHGNNKSLVRSRAFTGGRKRGNLTARKQCVASRRTDTISSLS